jgi:hypothetical protein
MSKPSSMTVATLAGSRLSQWPTVAGASSQPTRAGLLRLSNLVPEAATANRMLVQPFVVSHGRVDAAVNPDDGWFAAAIVLALFVALGVCAI